jgi:endonuclease/exonuclease/phosphatase (EEP) superfamily protein YafD
MGNLSLLTLNCFGVPGWNTSTRLRELGQEFNRSDYSVICLQEVQTHYYRRLLIEACNRFYPSQAYQDFLHAPKGGLMTFSREKFRRIQFQLFAERGLWYTPALADWILHKGVLITESDCDDVPVIVMNTHLTANYTGDWSRSNVFAKQEHGELMQIARLVNAQPDDALIIVGGDFNIPRGSWMYESFIAESGMADPLADDIRPTFRPHAYMGNHYAAPIDFTFYRAPKGVSIQVESTLRFQDKITISGRRLHLSDHMAIETRFSWELPKENTSSTT